MLAIIERERKKRGGGEGEQELSERESRITEDGEVRKREMHRRYGRGGRKG
jgi:hypothetical protein